MPTTPYTYPSTPAPQGGQGAFGAVPGSISLPNPAGALAAQYPDLAKTNSAVSGDILSKLGGQLSPATVQQLQSAAATYATANGMPGSNAIPGTLPYAMNLESLGLNSEQQQQQGIQDYNATIPTVSSTQTLNPALEAQIAEENALNAAAPNPAAAESYAESLYNQYLNQFKKSGGGTGSVSVSQPKPSPASGPTGETTITPSLYSPFATTSGSGMFFNGVWYPTGIGPSSTVAPPIGDMYGNASFPTDPETGATLGNLADIPFGGGGDSGE